VIAVAGLVPVGAGLAGIMVGPRMAADWAGPAGDVSLDSHFRYLSGLLLGLGLLFWGAIPTIERRGELVRALTLLVFLGGLSRLASLAAVGAPDLPMRLAFIMELVITPLICLWQWRLEQASAPQPPALSRSLSLR
jgi:hypothetical protein